jgi:hypothetical protein
MGTLTHISPIPTASNALLSTVLLIAAVLLITAVLRAVRVVWHARAAASTCQACCYRATFHIHDVLEGKLVSYHLCDQHARQYLLAEGKR